MISKGNARTGYVCRLDSKRCSGRVKRAGDLANKALRRYGDPTISLSELRTALDRQLHGISLTDVVLKDREAG